MHVTGNRRLSTKSSKARSGKRKGQNQYTQHRSLRVGKVMDDGKCAVDLLEKQNPRQFVSKRQGRERPFQIGPLFKRRRKTGVIPNNKCQPARVGCHVLGDEFRKLLRRPVFSFGSRTITRSDVSNTDRIFCSLTSA